MEEKELRLILEKHTLEIEKKVDDKLHKQEIALRDMFSNFEVKMLEAMDIQFESQNAEIKEVLDGHRRQCENVFMKNEDTSEFVKEKDLYVKTKEINSKIREDNTISFSNQSNLIISVVKIISWFVVGLGAIVVFLLKLGIIKI